MQEASVHASAVNQAKGDHIPWGWVAITAVGLEVAVTLSAFVWVGIYSYLIHPQEELPTMKTMRSSPVRSCRSGHSRLSSPAVGRTEAGTCAVRSVGLLIVPVIDIPLSLGQAKAYDWAMVAISNDCAVAAYS